MLPMLSDVSAEGAARFAVGLNRSLGEEAGFVWALSCLALF